MIELTKISGKWQQKWEESGIFKVSEDPKKKKCYVLEMYPYPSASYLHMGHVRNYTIGDVYARYKRMNGYNVLYPMGYDSFGLPAETAAKKEGIHPRAYTDRAIKQIMVYQKALGNSYDWDRVIASHDVNYYKWNQYFFNKMYERGLVYRKKAPVNWCETCQSTLANEEAESGRCWRCDNEVVKKDLEQWFFRITAYADRLLEDLDKIDWPEKIKVMQTNWIGKSFGTEIQFTINGEAWPVFTTRPDTIFGVTFMVISAQHPRLSQLVTPEHKEEMAEFLKRVQKNAASEDPENLDKDGVFTGSYAINPANGEQVPVWAGNFVIAEYGCGMVMAVPAHDERDFQFARKYDIPIRKVVDYDKELHVVVGKTQVSPSFIEKVAKLGAYIESRLDDYALVATEKNAWDLMELIRASLKDEKSYAEMDGIAKGVLCKSQVLVDAASAARFAKERGLDPMDFWMVDTDNYKFCYTKEGLLVNSQEFSGLASSEAIGAITAGLQVRGLGKKVVNYKIRDWMISRQRYWGTPIPIIHCDRCGIVPVPDKDLPVLLPENVDFKSIGNPLASCREFTDVKCPKCQGPAKRDTDTMGGFMDSSWYFLRYCDNKSTDKPFDPQLVKYWMPVDQYIGGAEHAVMHLLYARFFIKALHDMGIVDFDEPFAKLFNQGILYKDGAKMSKSKGNVIYQTDISDKYGIDTARLFLMFIAAPDKLMEWSDQGVEGAYRFLNRVIALMDKPRTGSISRLTESKLHGTIKEVTEDIESFQYNKAVISVMEFTNHLSELEEVPTEALKGLAVLLSPFTPHLSEEIWELLGEKPFISLQPWRKADESKIDKAIEAAEQAIASISVDIGKVLELSKIAAPRSVKLIVSPAWKYQFYRLLKTQIETTRDMKTIMGTLLAEKALSQFGGEISKIIPAVLKDQSKLPTSILSQEEDMKLLEGAKKKLSEQFKAEIIIELAEKSVEPKAKNGMPGKPAIVVA